eukprot:752689-Hanusia_phi.AAC.1
MLKSRIRPCQAPERNWLSFRSPMWLSKEFHVIVSSAGRTVTVPAGPNSDIFDSYDGYDGGQ